ncbi:amino acid adenylation domain-containing protein [Streptomyces sp. NPDC046860]|uniref:amino acid adenylation domain-containing protein n=1 Tax=Streptomyces sp. NPDC046860 TaxID=3154495 RepID=UPI0033E511B2
MTTLRGSQALNEYPEQTRYWRRWATALDAATLLHHDLLAGTGPEEPDTGVWEQDLDPGAVTRASALTGDEATLTEVFVTAAAAAVAAGETDSARVCVRTRAGDRDFPVLVDVGTDARALLTEVRRAYREGAAHLDVPPAQVLAAEGVVPTDLAVLPYTRTGLPDGITVGFAVRGGRLKLTYRADLLLPGTARRLAARFARAHARIAALGPVRGTPDAAEAEPVERANRTARDHGPAVLLHEFVQHAAARHPGRPAVLDGDGLTYAEFNARANRLARRLRELGAGPGEIVAVALPRGPEALTAFHAVLKAGAAYLPVDPALPEARRRHMVTHSGVRIAVGADCPGAAHLVDPADPALGALDGTDLPPLATGRDLAYVIYTSGSTGRPKGVMVEHRAIVNRLRWMQRQYPLTPADVVLHKTPTAFDVSLWEIFWWALAGCAVTTLPSGDERDPAALAARMTEHGVTTVHFVPSMLQAFLAHCAEGTAPAGLGRIFASGEALPADAIPALARAFPGPGAPALINLYGPTEAAVDVTHHDCTGHDPRRPVPLGTPIDNIRLRVLLRDGSPAPVGVPGELYLSGTGLARGYLGAPGLTAERFVPDPTAPGERSYRTGDAARWREDGTVEYLGRLDDQVKVRGHRIEPGEIEHALAALPGVTECAVALREGALCAYVVSARPDPDALRAGLARQLPSYMVPARFVPVPAIPRTPNGKRDLKALAALPAGSGSGTGRVAPRTPLEEELARIFAAALGREDLGTTDNFFELGGDSIKFIGVLAAARRAGLDFTFQELFAHPTVALLAPLVRRSAPGTPETPAPFPGLPAADRAALPAGAEAAYPLSSLQAGLLYEIATRDAAVYHDVSGYRYDAPLDPALFLRAAAEAARTHPMLRTSFHTTGFSRPVQVVHRDAPDWCAVVDLTGQDADAQRAYLERAGAAELATGFPEGTVGPVRMRLVLLGGDRHHLLLSYHAAALDGWSVNRLLYDLFDLCLGSTGQDGPPGTGYEEFVALEQRAVDSARDRDFWLGRLDGADATTLPRTPGAALDPAETVRTLDVPLDADLGTALLATAARLGVPLKSVLLAAHSAVLSFAAGRDDITTGYEHSGRPERQDAERTLGLFLNTLPFRVRTDAASWAELVRRVYDEEGALLPHRRYPLGETTRHLRRPLFEAVFNFTHFHVLGALARRHGARLRRVSVHSQTEFPLRAEFSRDALDDSVALQLHYDGSVFDRAGAARFGGYYLRALRALAADPDAAPFARTFMSEEERDWLARHRSGPVREVPGATLLDRFAGTAARHPDRTAVGHGTATLTYAELDRVSDRLAHALTARGAGPGDVVAVRMPRGLPWAVTLLGVMKAGAVYLPQEPGDPADRLRHAVTRSGCRHVVTEAEYTALLAAPGARPAREPGPDDPAYVIFTSGSTGEPKGAVVEHRGMLNHLQAKVDDLALTGDDVVSQVASQCFDISVWQLVAPWLTGGRSVIHDAVTDPAEFLDTVVAEGVSVLEVVPSLLDALLDTFGGSPRQLPDLRWLMVTGEAFAPALSRRWFAAFPDIPVVNAYGPTEASDDITHHVLRGPAHTERVPVGTPVINTTLHVLAENGTPVPPGTLGEIHVTGPCVGAGYVGDPERTAAAFPANTLDTTSARAYRTGDLGRWLPDGTLDCVGRRDQQVKLRGHRVELPEIEQALTRLDGVDQVFAEVRRHGGRTVLAVWYTGTAEPDLGRLREEAARLLPAYMLPDVVARLERVPLNRNGKADRNALAARPLPVLTARTPEPPADDTERAIVRLFAQALGVPEESVGANDDFFDLGGHSLAAMTVAARSEGLVTVRGLLQSRTARALARGAAGTGGLLVELADAPDPGLTVVCFPYAGGTPVGYLPLAKALQDTGPVRFRVLDLREDDVPATGALLRDLAAEIGDPNGPLVLLGHCAGAGAALALARALPTPPPVVLFGKTLKSTDPADHPVTEVSAASEETVAGWVVPGEPGAPAPDTAPAVLRALRRDTALGNAFLQELLTGPSRADHPLTVVLAADDPVTRDHEHTAGRWGLLARTPHVVRTEDGGHYLNQSRPHLLADVLRRSAAGRAPEGPHAVRQRP